MSLNNNACVIQPGQTYFGTRGGTVSTTNPDANLDLGKEYEFLDLDWSTAQLTQRSGRTCVYRLCRNETGSTLAAGERVHMTAGSTHLIDSKTDALGEYGVFVDGFLTGPVADDDIFLGLVEGIGYGRTATTAGNFPTDIAAGDRLTSSADEAGRLRKVDLTTASTATDYSGIVAQSRSSVIALEAKSSATDGNELILIDVVRSN